MIPAVTRALVAVGESALLSTAVKATIISLFALAALRLAQRSTASFRHLLLTCTFVVLLAVPLASRFGPSIPLVISIPSSSSAREAALPTSVAKSAVNDSAAASPITPEEGSRMLLSRSRLIVAAWIAGVLVFLLPIARWARALSRIRSVSRTWEDGSRILEATVQTSTRRRIDILICDEIPGPMTCGTVRPAIVFPADVKAWSDSAVRRAMVHELEHIYRYDSAIQIMAALVCALYWVHPLVWICRWRLGLEAERACDDAVLAGAEATGYAEQLVALAQRMTGQSKVARPAMANRGDLATRVAAVLDTGQRRGRSGSTAAATVIIASFLLTAVVSPLRAVSAVTIGVPLQGLSFEVASIRPSTADRLAGGGIGMSPGQLTIRNATLEGIAWFAHGEGYSSEGRISGGPDWVRNDRFDIEARAAERATPEQFKSMLGALLADRFKLRIHEETKPARIYEVVLARDGKLGPKLRATSADEAAHCASVEGDPNAVAEYTGGAKRCATAFHTGIRMRGKPLSDLTESLSELLETPVVDKTGLLGRYDADLDVTLDWSHLAGGGASDLLGANAVIFPALQDQLGLKLQRGRGNVRMLVIDSAQHPEPN